VVAARWREVAAFGEMSIFSASPDRWDAGRQLSRPPGATLDDLAAPDRRGLGQWHDVGVAWQIGRGDRFGDPVFVRHALGADRIRTRPDPASSSS